MKNEIDVILSTKKKLLILVCKKYHIQSLYMFGSVLRDDYKLESDIDILVDFEIDYLPGYFDFMRLQKELSLIFEKQIDLNTKEDLHEFFRERVLKESEVLYVAA